METWSIRSKWPPYKRVKNSYARHTCIRTSTWVYTCTSTSLASNFKGKRQSVRHVGISKTSCILNHVSGASSPRETTYANTSRDDVRDRPRDDVRDRPRDDVRDWPRARLRGSEAARQLGCEAARLRGNEAASERASRRASVITMITVSPSVSRWCEGKWTIHKPEASWG